MAANNFDFSRQIFLDRTGRVRVLSKASLQDWDLIQDLLLAFNEELLKVNPDSSKDFAQCWRESMGVQELGRKIVKVLGLKLKWLDEDMLGALLYSYEDAEGIPHKGKIFEWYFPDVIEVAGESVTWKEKYCKTIAGLWKSEGSLEAALRLSKDVPMDELDAIVMARVELEKEGSKKPRMDIPTDDIDRLIKEFGANGSAAHPPAAKPELVLDAQKIAESILGQTGKDSAKVPVKSFTNIIDQKWVDVDPNVMGI
jgi:hypothetical protein